MKMKEMYIEVEKIGWLGLTLSLLSLYFYCLMGLIVEINSLINIISTITILANVGLWFWFLINQKLRLWKKRWGG